MFRLSISTNTERIPASIYDENMKVIDVLAQNNISLMSATINLNGRALGTADLNKTFSEFGIANGGEATLAALVKTENAHRA